MERSTSSPPQATPRNHPAPAVAKMRYSRVRRQWRTVSITGTRGLAWRRDGRNTRRVKQAVGAKSYACPTYRDSFRPTALRGWMRHNDRMRLCGADRRHRREREWCGVARPHRGTQHAEPMSWRCDGRWSAQYHGHAGRWDVPARHPTSVAWPRLRHRHRHEVQRSPGNGNAPCRGDDHHDACDGAPGDPRGRRVHALTTHPFLTSTPLAAI